MLTVAKCESGVTSADVALLFDTDRPPSPMADGSVLPLSSQERVSMYVADTVEKMSQQTGREVASALERENAVFPNSIVDVRACGAVSVCKTKHHAVTVAGWTVTLPVQTAQEAASLGDFFLKAYEAMERVYPKNDVVFIVSLEVGSNVLPALRETMGVLVLVGDAVEGIWTIHAGDARFTTTKPHNNLCIAPNAAETPGWCLADLFLALFK